MAAACPAHEGSNRGKHVLAIVSGRIKVYEPNKASGSEILWKNPEHLIVRQLRGNSAKTLDLADIPLECLAQFLRRCDANRLRNRGTRSTQLVALPVPRELLNTRLQDVLGQRL